MATRSLDASFRMCELLGLFPRAGWSRASVIAYHAYQAMIFVTVFVVSTSMTVQLFVSPDLTTVARTIDLLTLCWSALYKWSAIALFSARFRQLHTWLADVHGRAVAARGRHAADLFVADRLRHISSVSYAYVLSGFLVCASLSFGPIVSNPRGDRSVLEFVNDSKSYPLCCWMPFTVPNYMAFTALWILKLSTLFGVINIYLIVDTFMFGAIYYMGVQLDIVGESLANIRHFMETETQTKAENLLRPISVQQQAKCYSMLCECVRLHDSILRYTSLLRSMFNTLILFDYLHALISLSFAMFQITISTRLGEISSIITFIIISLFHQFCNNLFGEYIIQKQLNVRKYCYDFPWVNVDKKSRQLLAIMICRSNKPLMITGLYMFDLCCQFFIMFIRTIYTYYMVLRKVNN